MLARRVLTEERNACNPSLPWEIAGVLVSQVPGTCPELAEYNRQREPCFAGLLVLTVHVFRGLGQCQHGLIEADAMLSFDFIACNGIGCPGLDGPKRAALDTRNLD